MFTFEAERNREAIGTFVTPYDFKQRTAERISPESKYLYRNKMWVLKKKRF